MHAVILSIGDELALGQTLDTNSAWLAARLAEHGIGCRYHQTLADDRAAVTEAITRAADDAPLVLITGGLGPTEDDLTRDALADALGKPLILDEPSLARIEAMFARRGRPMAQRNRVQAMHPATTRVIPNPNGTAPGIRARLRRATLFVMPGVPSEMRAMFKDAVAPELDPAAGQRGVILTATVNTFGRGESDVAQLLAELMDRDRNPKVGTTVTDGLITVRIRSEAAEHDAARQALDETLHEVERRLAPFAFGRDDRTLEEAVVALLRAQGLALTTAESCTGGLVAKLVTDVPGSSEVFAGGYVCYANAAKQAMLGVDAGLLAAEGAVSQPVAEQLARGALARCPGASVALAVTGIAGPGGGTHDKPVGTVYVALASADAADQAETLPLRLTGNRQTIRDRTAKTALQMLRLHLLGESLDPLRPAPAPRHA
ncbi:MAG: competence/damage-inducible protein A [Phycisphaeraceae bacterium]